MNNKLISKEAAISQIVKASVINFAQTFSERHISEVDNPRGTINMKIHNVFIAVLGPEIQYYASLVRSFDSSLGNMLETMALCIASLSFEVTREVQGYLYPEQSQIINNLLEGYKNTNNLSKPSLKHYDDIITAGKQYREWSDAEKKPLRKTHASDYCFHDVDKNIYHIVELKIGGDLDNKKARSEKRALLEQYTILKNTLDEEAIVNCYFATAYNRFGEEMPWLQQRVRQFFCEEELLIGKDFWNFVCDSPYGYQTVISEYKKNATHILRALEAIKEAYLGV